MKKNENINKIENPLDNLIGLYCVKAYCGYAGHLKIMLSKDSDIVSPLSNDLTEYEWDFETVSASWRLSEKDIILTGSYEDEEHNDHHLNSLVGKKLIKFKKNNATDYSLLFQDKFCIDTFNQGLSFHSLELHNNVDKSCLNLNKLGQWEFAKQEYGFSKLEKMQSLHSEKSDKRWSKIVPRESSENFCKNCAYFLTTSGQYYFWDYGICSNRKSKYDGKVVGVKSTCKSFSYELKT